MFVAFVLAACGGDSTAPEEMTPVASVTISPESLTLPIGTSKQLKANTWDVAGNRLVQRTVTWSSSAAAVAAVNDTGLVTAVGGGTAMITATSEGQSATLAVQVDAIPSVTVVPDSVTLAPGQQVELVATLRDATGAVVLGQALSWLDPPPALGCIVLLGSAGALTSVWLATHGGQRSVRATADIGGTKIYSNWAIIDVT